MISINASIFHPGVLLTRPVGQQRR